MDNNKFITGTLTITYPDEYDREWYGHERDFVKVSTKLGSVDMEIYNNCLIQILN